MSEQIWANNLYEMIQTLSNLGMNNYTGDARLNQGIANGISLIINVGVKPTATILLTLWALLELHAIINKIQLSGFGGTDAGITMFSMFFIKLGLASILLPNIDGLMWGLYNIVDGMILNIQSVSIGFGSSGLGLTYTDVLNLVSAGNPGFMEILMGYIECMIPGILIKISGFVVQIMFIGRMIEIYCYVAISPIAIGTFLSEEWSHIGKGFIKSFFAVCLQGAVMMIVIKVFSVILANSALTASTPSKLAWDMCVYGLLLVTSMLGASKLATKACGVA